MPDKRRYEIVKRIDLPHDVVVRIVQYFACWTPAPEIVAKIRDEFNIVDLQPFQIFAYDPDRPSGKDLPEELLNLHKEYREKYRESIQDIPIANQVYRLKELQRMYDKATREGIFNPRSGQTTTNPRLALECLEAAAKETGGVYKRSLTVEHTGAGGAPLPPAIVVQFAPTLQVPEPEKIFQIAARKEADAIDVEAV